MKFLISFYSAFIVISSIIVLFDGSMEMFAYLLWFHLANILVGSVGWLLINKLINPSSVSQIVFRFFAGLLVLNLLVFFLFNKIPTLTLIGLGKKYDNFWVSFSLHTVFLVSFLIASTSSIRKLIRGKI